MCLYILKRYRPKALIASSPITCYKVLRTKGGNLFSPYHNLYYWKLGKVHFNKNFTWGKIDDQHFPFHVAKKGDYIIFHGFHTFVMPSDAEAELDEWRIANEPFNIFYVYESIIPAGAKFHKGLTDVGRECYVSNQLIIKQKLAFM